MQQVDDRLAGLPAGTVADRSTPNRGITMSTVMLVLAATVLGVIGQIMLKQGMTQMGPLNLTVGSAPQLVWRIATAPMVVAGLLVYGVGTFFWLITLSRIELSVAYPFVSLNHVVIFLLAWLVLREQISPLRAAGVLVICVGMLLVARS